MDVQLRQATEPDIDQLTRFVEAYYLYDQIPFHGESIRQGLKDLIGDPSLGQVWLIVSRHQTIGYALLSLGFSLENGGRDAFLDEIFVDADHRRRGVGTEVLRQVEIACRDLGLRALHLAVERTNTAAQSVYRRFGFIEHDRSMMTKLLLPEYLLGTVPIGL